MEISWRRINSENHYLLYAYFDSQALAMWTRLVMAWPCVKATFKYGNSTVDVTVSYRALQAHGAGRFG